MRHSKALSLSLTVWVSISLLLSNAGSVFASDDPMNQGSDRVIQEQRGLSPSMKTGDPEQTQVNEPGLPTDRIIVKYKSSAQAFSSPQQVGQMERVSTAAGIALEYTRSMAGDSHVLQLPQRLPLEQVQDISQQLMLLPEVEYAEPDLILTHGLAPNDPLYGNQWHYFGTYGINAPAAWDITTGSSNIVMAVIDTGITNHADLSGRTLPGYDFISDVLMANDGNGRDSDPSDPGDWITLADRSGYFAGCPVRDSSWHGTHVAGTMGAASNNGTGVAGVNWNSKILPVRVLGKCGGYTSDIVDGMLWAAGLPAPGAPANPNPAKVLNLSLGGPGACDTTTQSAINSILSAGSVVVVAAGNFDVDASNFTPGNCSGVITVAATGADGWKAEYSNYGSTVEISAPGGNMPFDTGVLSTLNTGTTVPVSDTYEAYHGTSMAAPHVSGVVSLMLSLNPYLTPSQVLQILQSTAKPFFSGGGCTTSICGAGIVNAETAVNAVPPRINSFSPVSGAIGTTVTISGANFSRVTNVRFNGVSAVFSIISPTSIRATVPAGATTGPISVTNPAATVTSGSNNFTVLAVIAGPGIYDDTDSAWSYAGTWTTLSTSGPYNNTLHQTNSVGSSADLAFNGTQVKLTYLKAPGRGSFDVYIDGGKVATINENNASTIWQATWTSSILTSRVHTFRIQSLGGGSIDLDAIQVFAPDITTPAAINTLSATTGTVNGQVNLAWTAVGDDGTSGTATSYLVRYSTSAILNETAWNNATPVTTGIPVPKAAGQAESMTVGGLTGGQMYYFSIRVRDEVPNLGGLSNSPNAVAADNPAPGPGMYDGNDSRFVRLGTWTLQSLSGPYANTMNYSSNIGASATFTMNGSSFVLYYTQFTNRGNIEVYDGTTLLTTINANGALVWQKTWTSPNLGPGGHVIKFVHASGTYMDIDAIQVIGTDTTPPAAITNLTAQTGSLNGSVNLAWTAVGDDGTTGTVSSYLVRYSTSAITSGNWDAATPATVGVPTPKPAGQSESMTVTGLTPGSTYYFAVRAQDEAPNLGGLSNSPNAVAADNPAPGPGMYDGNDSRFVRLGTWTLQSLSGPYANTMNYSSNIGASATFTMNGSSFVLYYTQFTNRGNIEVYDGTTLLTTINANGALVWQKTWTSPDLGPGEHTIKFVHASGTYMDIDAIQVIGTDTTPPAAINGLSATTGVENGSVTLNWTAVGDDGTSGTATSYLVCYNSSPITSGNWGAAIPLTVGIPTPKPAGQSESMTVTGLTPGSTYYFAVRAQDEVPNLGAVSNSPSAVAADNPGVGPGMYDGNDSRFVRLGTWTLQSLSGPYANTMNYSSNIGASASITINGSSFVLYYTRFTNRGNIKVYDGTTLLTTINANGALAWQKTWTSPNLGPGEHIIKFVHDSGTYMDIDAIQVNAHIPAAGSGTYDGNDSRFVRLGTWTLQSLSGPYANTMNYSSNIGASATFTMNGSSFVLYYTQFTNRGNIEVYDGTTLLTTINANGALVWQKTWTSPDLGPGEHTIKFVHASGTYMDIDAIQVNP